MQRETAKLSLLLMAAGKVVVPLLDAGFAERALTAALTLSDVKLTSLHDRILTQLTVSGRDRDTRGRVCACERASEEGHRARASYYHPYGCVLV